MLTLKPMLLCLIVLSCSLWLKACTPEEKIAYNTLVASKAFLNSEQKAHPECSSTSQNALCVDLSRAVAAQHILADALEVYCSGPSFESGGACQAPKKGTPGYEQAQAKIAAAIANYSQIETDLKGLKQ